MATEKRIKLKSFLSEHLSGSVELSASLESRGISHDLQKHYCRSGWLESIGSGAMIRPGEQVTWQGALYTLQTQAGLSLHAGAFTALSLQGYSHYARFENEALYLFSPLEITLPTWFRNHDWGQQIVHERTAFLPESLGIVELKLPLFSIQISSPERAILECLRLAPKTFDIVECFHLMEGLTTLRPRLMQELLGVCRSIKVKRMFLYMAEKACHDWQKRLDPEKLDLGKGARSLAKGGVYVKKYSLTLPEELVNL